MRTKITFSSLANPPPPLLLFWCGDTQKGHLGCCSSLYDSLFLLQSGLHSGMCMGACETDTSPSSPSSGNILGNYSDKSNKGCGGTELEINLGYHQIYPWCISTPSRGRTGRGESGACTGKGQTKSDQGRKTSVESLSTPPSRAGRYASSRKRVLVAFFSLTDGN